MQPPSGTKSTAKRTTPATSYKPRVSLTGRRGWYRVQSGMSSSVYYETTANSCTCPARKPCKHMRFVRGLNVAFYVKQATSAPAPASALPVAASGSCAVCGDHDHDLRGGLCLLCVMDAAEAALNASLDDHLAAAAQILAIKRRALADAHPQSDEYAVLLRQVDSAERAVAALASQSMREA